MKKIKYAVVGLGYIAQIAVLPAFRHAGNSTLAALISGDPVKLKELGKKYEVPLTFSYEQYDKALSSGDIDAVYICLPNNMHCDFTVRAASHGVHVLCEKPMAVTEEECEAMIDAAEKYNVKLMTAYRLHFEEGNMKSVELVQSGKLGEPRYFNSIFSQQVKAGDIRLQKKLGGGTLYDIGIYCINAARYLFRSEPYEVFGFRANNGEERFQEVDEMTSVVMKFPDEQLASFVSSFGAADSSCYEIVGTEGSLRMEPAYEYAEALIQYVTVNGKTTKHTFAKRDQFAPELIYFSDCILNHKDPEPSGEEGLADVRIIRALYRSMETGRPIPVHASKMKKIPSKDQVIYRPAIRKPELINASSPSLK